jgi:hypothetical protein
MKESPQPTMKSMANAVQFLTKLKSWKHSKMNSHMELVMEQVINQMNYLNLHLS